MNDNSSKQILLSVIGVAILVIAVVGVSFAFFTYTRTGEQNNQITTGSIAFSFDDGDNTINLVNHFPITTAEGLALDGPSEKCTFKVTGRVEGNASIGFKVYAVPGNLNNMKKRFKDNEVFINIQYQNTTGMTFVPVMESNKGVAISTLEADPEYPERRLLGDGQINNLATGPMNFTVRMWVDSSVVSIGNSKLEDNYSSSEYGNLYYSMKIVVVAKP